MPKAMLFIDGTWLYGNIPHLSEIYGQSDFRIDFGKLPVVLAEEVSHQVYSLPVDLVRTFLFGSFAANYDARDDESVQRRRDFFEMLREEHHYEVETYPVNFLGRRLSRADRDIADAFEPKEKCVDIALASSLLYYAALPQAYDIAVVVVGDQDFVPVLQYVRRLGKRVAIASVKGSCPTEFSDPRDEARVKDFDIIWLDDLLHRLELRYERHLLTCESPFHRGKREVWTTYHPRKGQKFFCDICRREFVRQRTDMSPDGEPATVEAAEQPSGIEPGMALPGIVKRKFSDRGYGFIEATDGRQFFFHVSDLQAGLVFDQMEEGVAVEFEIKRLPEADRAGAVLYVRPRYEPHPAFETMGDDDELELDEADDKVVMEPEL
jgi:cold shock CspA family protein